MSLKQAFVRPLCKSFFLLRYAPELGAIVWNIKSFPGGKEYLMRAHLSLPSVEGDLNEGKPPIQVKFEIPYFTTSGIQVRINTKKGLETMLYYAISGPLSEDH